MRKGDGFDVVRLVLLTVRAGSDKSKSFCIDPFPKRHKLIHNGGFPKFEALYCSLNMVNSTETS